jgi:hypothetical protein
VFRLFGLDCRRCETKCLEWATQWAITAAFRPNEPFDTIGRRSGISAVALNIFYHRFIPRFDCRFSAIALSSFIFDFEQAKIPHNVRNAICPYPRLILVRLRKKSVPPKPIVLGRRAGFTWISLAQPRMKSKECNWTMPPKANEREWHPPALAPACLDFFLCPFLPVVSTTVN